MSLINKEVNSDNKENIIVEQYKTYIESADRNSDRRINTNNFYIVLNSMIITGLGMFIDNTTMSILLFVLGILFSIIWCINLINYKNISSCKYNIINEIENMLPIRMFKYEWEKLDTGKNIKKYIPVTDLEKIIPIIFILIYIILISIKVSEKIDIIIVLK